MRTFKDNAGRSWTVAISVDAIKRVRSLLEIDLLDIADGKLIQKLINDPIALCDVLYAVCKPDADVKNISDEEFGRAMAGDAIEHGTTALLEELVNFSPNPRDRSSGLRVLEKTWQVMEKARDVMEERLEAQIETIAEEALKAALIEQTPLGGGGPLSGSSPAS